MKVATSIGLALLASGALAGLPSTRPVPATPAVGTDTRAIRFDGVDSMMFGEGSGCAYVLVVLDSATQWPIPWASVHDQQRRGGMTDSLGRCVICGLPDEGILPLRVVAHGFPARWDTARILGGRPDTLVIRLVPNPVRDIDVPTGPPRRPINRAP